MLSVMKDLTVYGTIAVFAAFCVNNKAQANDCVITLYKKKETAKTVYTSQGESISLKTLVKLSDQCVIKTPVMSESMKKKIEIERLQKKLNKLKAK